MLYVIFTGYGQWMRWDAFSADEVKVAKENKSASGGVGPSWLWQLYTLAARST